MLLMRRTQQQPQPGNELTELLWDNGPALQRPQLPATPFPPFACSAAGASRAQELAKHHHPAMRDLLAAPDDDDAVPWLQHYPDIGVDDDDGDRDTAPLPPEYCSALLSGYSSHPAAVDSRNDAGGSTSHGAAVGPPTVPPKQHQARPSGEGIMNFTFFSKPLQRPQPPPSAAPSIPVGVGVESTVVQTNRLRCTPLFSEQRMAWLQPPPKESCPTVAASPPPPPAAPPVPLWQREFAAAVAALPQRRQSETRAPDRPPPLPPATATTSSVCSDNGDRSQLKRSSGSQQAPEWSVSQEDEDLEVDDEAGGARRSAARSTKRGRTAEVHNMSERRRRDRINEKMRALQELIPNCNKIDKASMLEEAIEYLKTLQLQVQMMSTMGCVPPMLAMQHMQMPPMAAHFHHHHLGAMGFGMGAFDPRLVAAAAGAAQFPYPMIPGMPMFGHGHAMPSPPPFPHQAAAAAMGAHVGAGIVVDNDGTAAAHAEQQTPGDHAPHVPRTM